MQAQMYQPEPIYMQSKKEVIRVINAIHKPHTLNKQLIRI